MSEPIIYKVDEDEYYSGRMIDSLRFFWYSREDLRFYDAKCNWTWNKDTEKYYQILAEDQWQAEDLARKTYANEFHISESFVDVKL